MPYITKTKRQRLDSFVSQLAEEIDTGGELNYAITYLCQFYLGGNQQNGTYAALSEIVGHLDCAKLELYRRLVAPYEDTKAAENGDVYWPMDPEPTKIEQYTVHRSQKSRRGRSVRQPRFSGVS